MKKQISGKDIAFYTAILILVLVILYSGLRILESTVFHKDQNSPGERPSKTIVRDGVSYFPRQDITVVLVMGIDQAGKAESSGSYNNSGTADMVTLLVFDEKNQDCTVLCLNRDTMVTMPVLGIGGKPAGTLYGQLALAHTYGNGLQNSCENTRKAVSDFLYGLHIDYYLSLRMDAISILNDCVGGVSVEVTEDFSEVDPSLPMGKVTLTGQQAVSFIRSRKDVGTQLNLSRMERHKAYMDGFMVALRNKLEGSDSFILELYSSAADYMVTDISSTTLNAMANRYGEYPIRRILSPEGENVMGKAHYEFHVDEEKLDELILSLFYAPKN